MLSSINIFNANGHCRAQESHSGRQKFITDPEIKVASKTKIRSIQRFYVGKISTHWRKKLLDLDFLAKDGFVYNHTVLGNHPGYLELKK